MGVSSSRKNPWFSIGLALGYRSARATSFLEEWRRTGLKESNVVEKVQRIMRCSDLPGGEDWRSGSLTYEDLVAFMTENELVQDQLKVIARIELRTRARDYTNAKHGKLLWH